MPSSSLQTESLFFHYSADVEVARFWDVFLTVTYSCKLTIFFHAPAPFPLPLTWLLRVLWTDFFFPSPKYWQIWNQNLWMGSIINHGKKYSYWMLHWWTPYRWMVSSELDSSAFTSIYWQKFLCLLLVDGTGFFCLWLILEINLRAFLCHSLLHLPSS